ncbi:MAG: amidohydrolase family protein [Flavonifractor plautii]
MTTVLTGPGSANPIAGQFLALKTDGRWVDEMVLKAPAAMKFALGENPKSVYNDRKETPVTRMAIAALIREHLAKPRSTRTSRPRRTEIPTRTCPITTPSWRRWCRWWRESARPLPRPPGRRHRYRRAPQPGVRAEAGGGSRHGGLSGARAAGGGGGAGHHRALPHRPLQAGAGGPDPGQPGPAPPGGGEDRHLHRPPGNAHPVPPPLRGYGGAGGLDPEEALAAITSSAAEIAGLSKRVGTLTPGKDADVVVTSGHPFDWNGEHPGRLSQRSAGQIISLGPVRMDRAQAIPYRKMYLSRKTRASIASTGLTFFRLSAPVKRWTAT